jgi:hypothetical protein
MPGLLIFKFRQFLLNLQYLLWQFGLCRGKCTICVECAASLLLYLILTQTQKLLLVVYCVLVAVCCQVLFLYFTQFALLFILFVLLACLFDLLQ